MKLRCPLPPGWSYEQIAHHYEVEKRIADRLRRSSRDERREIYRTMYDELFAEVPWHPRLTKCEDVELIRAANARKWALLSPYVDGSSIYAEFGPGDCTFAHEVARRARFVYAIDISDQRGDPEASPDNFQLIVYDGYELALEEGSVDVVFSDALLEHIHPDDAEHHLRLAHSILRPGGRYVLKTPHAYCGPHDISKFFSETPQGFHLKEWTYGEMIDLLRRVGFRSLTACWELRHLMFRVPTACPAAFERLMARVPTRARLRLSGKLLHHVCIAAMK